MSSTGVWNRFGLAVSPFETSPSPSPLTGGPFQRVFSEIGAAIDARCSLLLLSGHPGTGRTTMAQAAIAASKRADAAAWLPAEAGVNAPALFRWLLAHLGAAGAEPESLDTAVAGRRLLQRLGSQAGAAAAPLIVADDLEEISASAFEELLRLLAATAGHSPPLSALLIAAPALAVEVGKAAAASLPPAQIAEIVMPALDLAGSEAYIAYRLEAAGYSGPPPFTDDALIRIANISRGQPLRINRLCEACFDGASPRSLPLGTDTVVAALASSLSASERGGPRPQSQTTRPAAAAPPVPPPVPPAASSAASSAPPPDDEDARLEKLASRVNAVMHRSFQTRIAEQADAAPTETKPAAAITAEFPRHAHPPPPPAAPPPSAPRREPVVEPRRSRPLFAVAAVLLIAGAGAAIGWLSMSDWQTLLKAKAPPPPPALMSAAPAVEAPPPVTAAEAPPPPPPPAAAEPAAAPPPDEAAAPPPPLPVEPAVQEVSALLARGEALLRQADVGAAQLFFRLAAEQGSAAGAMALAASFDPVALKEAGVRRARGNPGEALAWYRRAAELGDATAEARRDRLIAHLRTAAAGGDPAARATLEGQR